MSVYNDALPIKFLVKEKLMFNRYKLIIGKKEISTKSSIELEPNTYYLAEIYDNLVFKNLQKFKNFNYLNIDCFTLLEYAFNDNYQNILINSLLECDNKNDYECYKTMLFALYEDILYLPCLLNNEAILIEYRKKKNELAIYYNVFAKLSLSLKDNSLNVSFNKLLQLFSKYFHNINLKDFNDDFFKLNFKGIG